MEPPFFEQYPVTQKCIDLMLALAKNMSDIEIYFGEFPDGISRLDV